MPQKLTVVFHQSIPQMNQWLAASPTPAMHTRRMAVVLAAKGRGTAKEIAEEIGASERSVQTWIRLHNAGGPDALNLNGRGGRRNELMSAEKEAAFIAGCQADAEAGRVMTGQQIRRKAAKLLGETPSQPWVYFLLERHGWRKIVPRPTHVKGDPVRREEFKKNSEKLSKITAKKRK